MDPNHLDSLARLLARDLRRREALRLLAAAALASLPIARGAAAAERREVIVDSLSKTRITGRLVAGKSGLRFDARLTDRLPALSVQTLDKRSLLSVKASGGDIVTSLGGGRLTARVKQADLRSARAATQPRAGLARLREATTTKGGAADGRSILAWPEYALLPALADALGTIGMTARRFPPILSVHVAGLMAATDLRVDPGGSGASYLIQLPPSLGGYHDMLAIFDRWYVATDCWSPNSGAPNVEELPICEGDGCEPYPNGDQGCYGMCGWGCSCWSAICGDCCYHDFCAFHDDLMGDCTDDPDPANCYLATDPVAVQALMVLYGGCDGWL